jgi:mRNA interferase RelE/StbE
MYQVLYLPQVRDQDLPTLDPPTRKRIRRAIEQKLTRNPEEFGNPLRGPFASYRKLRVGDYRVVYRVRRKEVVVLVVMIGHRREVYLELAKRLRLIPGL